MVVFIIFVYILAILEIITALTFVFPFGYVPWDIVDDLIPCYLILYFIFFILFIGNLIYSISLYKKQNKEKLKIYFKRTKLFLIPFWIINFIVLAIVLAILVFGTRGIGIIIVPIPIFMSYVILISTSVFGIFYLVLLKKNNEITKDEYIVNILLQFLFVFDIVSLLYLMIKKKVLK
jgi:hypothetical protein